MALRCKRVVRTTTRTIGPKRVTVRGTVKVRVQRTVTIRRRPIR